MIQPLPTRLRPSELHLVESEVGFRQAALSVLNESLQKGDLDSSNRLLEQISKASGLSTDETRVRLLSLLDTLDAHRRQKSEVWQKLVTEIEKEVGPKVAEKASAFLSGLSDRSRKMLTVKADYRPQWELDEAAKKARITPQDGKRIILRSLSLSVGNAQAQAPPLQIPSKIGVVVEARSNFEEWNPVPPWRQFFATGDDMERAIQIVRGIAQSVVPVLVEKLPDSPSIKWAVEKPSPSQKPDFKVTIDVRSFGLYAGIRSKWGDDVTPVVRAVIMLQPIGDMGTVLEESFTVKSYICHNYQDVKPPDMNILYGEIAQKGYEVLDSLLSKRSRDQSVH